MKRVEIPIDSEYMEVMKNDVMERPKRYYLEILPKLSEAQKLIAERIEETEYCHGIDDPKLDFTQEEINSLLQSSESKDIQAVINSAIEGIVTHYELACGNVQELQ